MKDVCKTIPTRSGTSSNQKFLCKDYHSTCHLIRCKKERKKSSIEKGADGDSQGWRKKPCFWRRGGTNVLHFNETTTVIFLLFIFFRKWNHLVFELDEGSTGHFFSLGRVCWIASLLDEMTEKRQKTCIICIKARPSFQKWGIQWRHHVSKSSSSSTFGTSVCRSRCGESLPSFHPHQRQNVQWLLTNEFLPTPPIIRVYAIRPLCLFWIIWRNSQKASSVVVRSKWLTEELTFIARTWVPSQWRSKNVKMSIHLHVGLVYVVMVVITPFHNCTWTTSFCTPPFKCCRWTPRQLLDSVIINDEFKRMRAKYRACVFERYIKIPGHFHFSNFFFLCLLLLWKWVAGGFQVPENSSKRRHRPAVHETFLSSI